MNPYHVLEVTFGADFAEIRASYRRLVRVHHPDRAPNAATRNASSERMVKINWAWHILGDAERRAAFDARFGLEQIETARRQQEALRAQMRGQAERAQKAHLGNVAQAQAAQAQAAQAQAARSQDQEPNRETLSPRQSAREQQFLAWQAAERARQERVKRAREEATRPVRARTTREEKQRQSKARARLRSEDKKRGSAPSARRQLVEAARLFAQESRAGDAIAICHDVLRVDARNVPARELLGDFYLQLGRQDRALPLWEQALALQPDNSSVRRKLNALRPHETQSYRPQPSIPRASAKHARGAQRLGAAPLSFWSRVRDAFKSGL